MNSCDVVIVGSGVVGLTQALLLAQTTPLCIALIDVKIPGPLWSESDHDSRVYALTPASQQILEQLDVWPQIQAKRASPFKRMQVWDSCGGELVFDHAQLSVPALGHIIEENLLRSALLEKIGATSQIDLLYPLTLTEFREETDYIDLHYTTSGGLDHLFRTRLLIGADGAKSWVRTQAGITHQEQSYHHSSLIAQVETEEAHHQTARQVFLSGKTHPNGPLAFLPLVNPQQCSIVWSTTPTQAEALMNLEDSSFQTTLAEAFSFRLGKVLSVSKRQIFPLYERHADHYVKNRLALIGDAAHTIHPLAGQGVNLGMADAALLAQVIAEALKKNREYASLSTLRRYERSRKADNGLMLSAVKVLKFLFGSENQSLAFVRNQGLMAVNQLPLLKSFFARYAMGTGVS